MTSPVYQYTANESLSIRLYNQSMPQIVLVIYPLLNRLNTECVQLMNTSIICVCITVLVTQYSICTQSTHCMNCSLAEINICLRYFVYVCVIGRE